MQKLADQERSDIYVVFTTSLCLVTLIVGETGVSCNSFYSNPRGMKSVEYLKHLFIS